MLSKFNKLPSEIESLESTRVKLIANLSFLLALCGGCSFDPPEYVENSKGLECPDGNKYILSGADSTTHECYAGPCEESDKTIKGGEFCVREKSIDDRDLGFDAGSDQGELIDSAPDTPDVGLDQGDLTDAKPDTPDANEDTDMRVEEDMNVSDMGSDTDIGPSCNPNTPEEVTDLIRRSFIYKVPTNPVRGSNSAPITTTTDNPNFILQVGDSATNCEITNIFYGPNDPNFTKDLTIGQDCVDTDLKKALQLEEGRLSAGQARLHGGLWIYQGDSMTIQLKHYVMPTISNETLNTGTLQESLVINGNTGVIDYKTSNSNGNISLCSSNIDDLKIDINTVLTKYKNDSGL